MQQRIDPVVFWCQLYEEGDYKELALLLLSISPTSVLCERGFSTMRACMNYVKNEFRSLLTQENLNACMSLGMTSHSVHTFPFHTFFKKLESVLVCVHFSFFIFLSLALEVGRA